MWFDGLDGEKNPGNFLKLLQLVANHNKTLKNHLSSPVMKNATYMSPQTQNDVLDILGNDFILHDIITEVKEAKFYSILADEVTSHNVEHLAFCVCFVDRDDNIREEFLKFVPLSHITGVYLAKTILQTIEKIGLDPSNIRGQGYDGAANMSSQNVAVQGEIKKVSLLETYMHCSSYCLNLLLPVAFQRSGVCSTG